MKRSIQALLVLSVSLAATPVAADTTELLERVDRLVAQKKYWTAIKTLNEADRGDLDSDVALEKLDIALDYFAVSIMHEVFGFRDLSKGETIEDIRGESGTYKMVALKPAEMIGRLIEKTPDDFRLHKALGDYYFDVLLRYAGEWTEPDEAIRERCRTYYLAALEHGVSDPQTHYALGYLDLLEGDHDGAVSSLERAVAGNPRSADAHYNLAYAYLHLGKPNKALTHAGKSLELYEDRAYRGDAARMIATIHGELQDLDNSLMYHLEADRIDPGNYVACAWTGGQTTDTPRAGDAEAESTFQGYGFRVLVGSAVEVREESPVEDFVLYTFTRQGVSLLHAYSGNHPQFPSSFEHGTPERHMVINGLGARCFAGEKDGASSRECVILLEENPLPHYVHVWYDSLAGEDRERADAIISSIVRAP